MSDQPLVGVVGTASTEAIEAVEAAGARVERGDVAPVLAADPDRIVAVGESAALAVARERPAAPLVPVDSGRGLRSLASPDLPATAGALVSGDFAEMALPVLAVERGGEVVCRAAADVTVVTAEAAHISEYTVASGGERVGRFRADGVVLATPAGSPGYARSVGAPVVAPGTDVVAVAPIAPFATSPDHWVLPLEGLTVTVEREEAEVALLADDRTVGPASPHDPLTVRRDGRATVAVFDRSRSPFE